jgi:hypothetical protein
MKWFAVCAVLLSVAVSVTEAVMVRGANQQNSVERKLEPNDYDPWVQGTVVYYEFDDGWYWGTIIAYENGAYTTSWSDGDEEVFTDLAAVDQMVQNAADDNAWDVGTVIYYKWPDEAGWYWGTIAAYDNGAYTTTWSHGYEEVFTDIIVVDQMVQNADDNAWELGTVIYYKWPDEDGWYWGTITAYDNGAYTTTWSHGYEEVFTDLVAVDQMVQNADDNAWELGTVVHYEFDDGWYWGTITAYDNGAYTTTWSNRDEEKVFEDLAAVDQMVQNADDNAWDVGTVIYYKRPGEHGWYWGTVTAYDNPAYTTTWSDGDEEVFSDDVVDQMVQNADDNAWDVGTVIYYKWPGEDGWYWGTITAYDNGAYTTTWSHGYEEVFTDIIVVDQMVQNVDAYAAWDVGTVIYYKWPDEDGWYWGTITAYENGAYSTTWPDGYEEIFTDIIVVDQMVKDADDQAWDVGTVIYYKWPAEDGWYWGTITAYDNGVYTTTWSDGEEEVFNDLAVVNQMVEDASQARSADTNPTNKKAVMSSSIILVVAVFAAVGVAAFFLKRRQEQKLQQKLEGIIAESTPAQIETDLPFIT